jgi:hypothetical protein
MKSLSILTISTLLSVSCIAQLQITRTDRHLLMKREDSMKVYSMGIIGDSVDYRRFQADSMFTKMFVRALKTPNSFYYPFDSLITISTLYAPDSSFRIFTWQLIINDNVRQHGAIQMRTADGSLKLLPLIDKSELMYDQADSATNNRAWYGAVYYNIIETKDSIGDPYYTLFGYDENNMRSSKKLLEVLTFDENGQPVFGQSPYFSFEQDTAVRNPVNRFILEFKKDAGPKLNYDNDMGMIIVEHLESESGEPKKKWTLVPDGDYEAFKWANTRWVHIEKIFHQITPDGQAPVPEPLKQNGDLLHDKLGPQDNKTKDAPIEQPVETPPSQSQSVPNDNP